MNIASCKKTEHVHDESGKPTSNSKHQYRSLAFDEQLTETFCLLWLDENAQSDSLDSFRTKVLLKELNNNSCLFFDQYDDFVFEIQRIKHTNRKMLVVTSGLFAKEVLPKIGDIISIMIIFCQDYENYADLPNKYSIIVEMCADHEKLRTAIQNELGSLKFNLIASQAFRSTRPMPLSNNIEKTDADFLYILCIEMFKRMPRTEQAKEIMLKKCKDYYRRDAEEVKKIEEFQNTYTSDTALNWYIEESFIYKLVNRALRTQDVTLWYSFRYYIVDLCTQLEDVHKQQNIQTILNLYRGQSRLPTYEWEKLKSNIGSLYLTNGFFSSTKDITIAQNFIDGAVDTDDFKVVMFEITVDASRLRNVVFVDIDKYTHRDSEKEVLFNIGSVFKIIDVNHNAHLGAWVVKMEATDEDTDELNKRIAAKIQNCHQNNINFMFGRLLIDMHEYSKAQSYFQLMLRELSGSKEDLALVYDYIGDLNMRITNWKQAFDNFYLAYEIKRKRLSGKNPSLAATLNNIGNYYKAIGYYDDALRHYKKALKCTNVNLNLVKFKLNIASIQGKKENWKKALDLCRESSKIRQKIEPTSNDDIIRYHGIMGDIYLLQKKYDIAEACYIVAFELSKRVLSLDHRLRLQSVKCMCNLYMQSGKKEYAIEFCQEQLSLYEKYLTETHANVACLLMKMGELYEDNDDRKIHSLLKALRILESSVNPEYATRANCLMLLAGYYKNRSMNKEASKYYSKALEIQKLIYPANHHTINETESLLRNLSTEITMT